MSDLKNGGAVIKESRQSSNQQTDAGNDPENCGVSVNAHQQTQMPGASDPKNWIVCGGLSIEFGYCLS